MNGIASQALIPTVTLANGAEMQKLALGLYNVPRDQVKAVCDGCMCPHTERLLLRPSRLTQVVIDAGLGAGLRHFDFASFYDNEVAGAEPLQTIEVCQLTMGQAECGAALRSWLSAGPDGDF